MSDKQPPHVIDAGHDYDGIEELDNRLPRWWLLTLHGAIVFAVGYWAWYHTFDIGPDQLTALHQEIERADKEAEQRLAAMGGLSDELLAGLSHDDTVVSHGREVYATNCIACHGARGEGTVGPNLTDAYWLHGHRPVDIHAVVSHGKLDKGMPSWEPVLGPKRVRDVVAYVLTLGETPVEGKPPQGTTPDGKSAPTAQLAPRP